MKIKVKEAEAEYCINCGALCKHPVHSGRYTFCSQGCYFDFLEHEEIPESKAAEAVNVVSHLLINKATGEEKVDALVSALEGTILHGHQEVETRTFRNGTSQILIHGHLDPIEASGVLRMVEKLGILLDEVGINQAE